MAKNPKWHRDELILALDLYLQHRKVLDDTHPAVIELSKVLNALPLYGDKPDAARFRNPNGVALRLANFAHLDPEHPGAGMKNVGPAREVWEEMSADPRAFTVWRKPSAAHWEPRT